MIASEYMRHASMSSRPEFNRNEIAVMTCMGSLMPCERVCPSHGYLAGVMRVGVNTVRRTIASLREKGVLVMKRRKRRDGSSTSSQYWVNWERFLTEEAFGHLCEAVCAIGEGWKRLRRNLDRNTVGGIDWSRRGKVERQGYEPEYEGVSGSVMVDEEPPVRDPDEMAAEEGVEAAPVVDVPAPAAPVVDAPAVGDAGALRRAAALTRMAMASGEQSSFDLPVADAEPVDADPVVEVVDAEVIEEGPSKEIRVVESRELAPLREDVERICDTMIQTLKDRGVVRIPKVTGRWRDAARLMLDRDGIPLESVLGAIHWSARDDFWSTNILSVPKLREKYDQLRLQALRERRGMSKVDRVLAGVEDDGPSTGLVREAEENLADPVLAEYRYQRMNLPLWERKLRSGAGLSPEQVDHIIYLEYDGVPPEDKRTPYEKAVRAYFTGDKIQEHLYNMRRNDDDRQE